MEPIAIVGMACRLPPDISTLTEFWGFCAHGRSAWTENPEQRFGNAAFWNPNPDRKGKVNNKGGHYLKHNLAHFDAPFFRITADEAKAMDPQQRFLLEIAYQALENGGFSLEEMSGKNVAVFAANAFSDYLHGITRDPETAAKFVMTGCDPSMIANRISHFFDFHGPSITVDTACSSGLTALHMACQTLQSGEVPYAIVAGAHLNIYPQSTILYSLSQLLSPEGKCYAFDERATGGFGRGEGAACLVLKPLSVAMNAGDHVYAVIKNTGINQDGRTTTGITVPSADAQKRLIKSVYESCGLCPSQTQYIEAHGTGTAVGDPIEVQALSEVFGKSSDASSPTFLGSSKSNFGHCEGVSGLVSVIKTAMMLEKEMILPNSNFCNPNPDLNLERHNLSVLGRIMPWPKSQVRRASVNNFGIGGSNSHAILEQAPKKLPGAPSGSSYIIAVSASCESSNRMQLTQLSGYVRKHPLFFNPLIMEDLAFTLSRRSSLPWKTALVARNPNELIEKLRGSSTTPTRATTRPSIGLVFTGQGAHWPKMGQDLLCYPAYANSIERSQAALTVLGEPWSLRAELGRDEGESKLGLPQISQVACCAVQIALVDLLWSWGLEFTATVGHSSGEIAAGYAAGLLSLSTCIKIAYHRGMITAGIRQRFPELRGSMIAVGCTEAVLQGLLDSTTVPSSEATIACKNSPLSFTVSGDSVIIGELHDMCEERNIFNRVLKVDIAYHSSHMELVAEDYLFALGDVECGASLVRFFSSTEGRLLERPILDSSYWKRNLTGKVLFSESIASLLQHVEISDSSKQAVSVLVEVGPHGALKGPVLQTVESLNRKGEIDYLPTLGRGKNGVDTMQELAATLFAKGVPLDLHEINFGGIESKSLSSKLLVDMPHYPWKHDEEYWLEPRINQFARSNGAPYNDLLGTFAADFNPIEPRWRNVIRLDDLPWLRDHKVQSEVVFPMAGYLSMAIEAASKLSLFREKAEVTSYLLREVFVKYPLMLSEMVEYDMTVSFRPYVLGPQTKSSKWHEFVIYSQCKESDFEERCRGRICVTNSPLDGFTCKNIVPLDFTGSSMDENDFYAMAKRSGVEYGSSFRGLHDISIAGSKAIANLHVLDTASTMSNASETSYVLHPATLDMLMQMVLITANSNFGALDRLYMPRYIERLDFYPPPALNSGTELAVSGIITDTSIDLPKFDLSAQHNGNMMISMSNVHCRGRKLPQTSNDITDYCYKLEWRPMIDILSCEEIRRAFQHSDADTASERSRLSSYKEISGHYIREALDELGDYDASRHSNMYRWMKQQNSNKILKGQIDTPVASLPGEVRSLGPVGEFLSRFGRNLARIVREEVEPLDLMLEDDLLTLYYENLESLKSRLYPAAASIMESLAHQNPELRILEIGAGTGGATLPILSGLGEPGRSSQPQFATYVFTDISPGFFERSRVKLRAWQDFMEFRTLDIETPPVDQGWEEESYDLVIAANVLHATPSMSKTMANVRSLLKPGGKLLLLEITRPSISSFPFTALPGWWVGEEDYRQDGPTMSSSTWNEILKSTGFAGTEAEIFDYPDALEQECSLILSSRIGPQHSSPRIDLSLVTGRNDHSNSLATCLQACLRSSLGVEADIRSLETISTDAETPRGCIILEELDTDLLYDINDVQYKGLQRITEAERTLWVVTGANKDSLNPKASMSLGLSRSIREENHHQKIVVLDLDDEGLLSLEETANLVVRVYAHSYINPTATAREFEFAERKGIIQIPRFKPHVEMNDRVRETHELFTPKPRSDWHSDSPLKLKEPGIDEDFHFVDSGKSKPVIGPLEVEILVKAAGVSFRGAAVEKKNIPGNLDYEHSGVITATGDCVKDLSVGDRVCAFTKHTLSTIVRVPSILVVKIPDEMTYITAASIPKDFVTAYYSLVTFGNLKRGDSVLIHPIVGGVGQMAMRIAHIIGATVFGTADSSEEGRSIAESLQIPCNQILCEKQNSCYDELMNCTAGRGFDVILNTHPNDALDSSWKCVGPGGTFVNLALKDVVNDNRLSMAPFSRGSKFISPEIDTLKTQQPLLLRDIMARGVDWLSDHHTVPPLSPKCHPAGAMDEVFSDLIQRASAGKLVVDLTSPAPLSVTMDESIVPLFTPEETFLVIGGGGGIGRSIIRWMTRRGARNIIIMSRRGLQSRPARDLQSELQEVGVKLAVYQGDIADGKSLEYVIQTSAKTFPPIKGVIHCAMDLKTMLFVNMPFDDFGAVLRPKVQGAWNLHRHFNTPGTLRFFIIISSFTGTVGPPSHAAYGAATAYMGSMVRLRKAYGLPGVSIDLGPVRDVGYIAEQSTRQQVIDRNWGDAGLTARDIHEILEMVISGRYDPSWDAECYTCLRPPPSHTPFWFADDRFLHCRHSSSAKRDGTNKAGENLPVSLKAVLSKSQSPKEDRSIIRDAVISKFISVLSLHPDDIVKTSPPITYGVDSLVAVEIRNWIFREMKAALSLPELLNSASFIELSETIAQRYWAAR
ncbi:hypothetical protein N7465_005783 [Penicillium sp. CMV-2018d]|nr:hypothetical protein N7465_005783 [Penicillium sp. CMV-2018d]